MARDARARDIIALLSAPRRQPPGMQIAICTHMLAHTEPLPGNSLLREISHNGPCHGPSAGVALEERSLPTERDQIAAPRTSTLNHSTQWCAPDRLPAEPCRAGHGDVCAPQTIHFVSTGADPGMPPRANIHENKRLQCSRVKA